MSIKHKAKCFRAFILSILGIFAFGGMYAQTVTGTVTSDRDGSPLAGATVLVQGTTTGAFTDDQGKYTVAAEGNAVLIFSYVGYERQNVAVEGRSEIDVKMLASEATLEEVVVTGYGTQKAKEVTSSITSVKVEDFNGGNVNDPTQLLQGKVAGLSIARPGGDPNGGFNIRLRGISSLGQGSQPLIIIDGVPGASLNSVDPNDIQSMDILKDGSAAAIYGTRASAGVIIITTKQGIPGVSKVDYSGYVALESIDRTVDVLSADEYRAFPNSSDLGSSTDWFDEITRDAISHVHNVALSGGSGQTQYRISLNLRNGQGVALNTGFTQLNGRINLTQRAFNDRLKFTVNLAATSRDSELGFNEAFRYATIYNPTSPVFADPSDELFERYDGYAQQILFDYFNPFAILDQNQNLRNDKRLNLNMRADWEVVDGLTFGVFYALQRENDLTAQYFDRQSFWRGADRNGLANRGSNDRYTQVLDATVQYEKDFGGLNLKLLGGYSYQEFINEGFFAEGGNFIADNFTYNNLGASLDFKNGLGNVTSYKNASELVAFFGRINLSYDNTYYLTASVRQEGSTKFGANNKWGTFPAISGGVILSNLFDAGPFDLLKLRAGYGETGNIPNDSYLSILRLGPGSNFFFNGNYVPSYGPASNPNPNLKWETKAEINIGLDFSLLDNRLSGTIDAYNRDTRDLLLLFPVPVPPNLFPETWVNIGQLNNRGLEFDLRYLAVDNSNFTWEPAINFSTFSTNLVSLSNEDLNFGDERFIGNLGSPGLNGTPLVRVREGNPLGEIWGPVVPEDNPVGEDGNWNIQDLDGDGTNCDCLDDERVVGNGLPDFQIGINNSFTFGDFDLNFFFRGVVGHDLLNTFRAFYEVPSVINSYNVLSGAQDIQELTDAPKFSSYHVEDASFIKLDNATLGYTMDVSNLPISNLRFYIAGQNLITLTNYSGVDPEIRFEDSGNENAFESVLMPGIDRRNTWFRTRTITVGVNLGF
jgi:TonB-linked SusC/RagA family outer membrane protein